MMPSLRKFLFDTLYKNRYLYRFASTVPFAGQWRVWQKQVLTRLRGHDVLELGCGLGDLLADMLAEGYECRAVEHSPQMVAAARDTLEERQVGRPAYVIQGRAQRLPFQDATFDSVVSTFPNEYIFDPDTIAEIERVLRPGGIVIIVLASNLLPTGYIQSLLLLLHALVYGKAALQRDRQARSGAERLDRIGRETNSGIITEVLPGQPFGKLIPLEQFDLVRRSELVRSQRWEMNIVIGEKLIDEASVKIEGKENDPMA